MTIDTQALYNKAAANCQRDEPVLLSDSSPLGGPGLHSPSPCRWRFAAGLRRCGGRPSSHARPEALRCHHRNYHRDLDLRHPVNVKSGLGHC